MILPWPTTLEAYGIGYEPDDDLARYKPFAKPPTGVVIHSGDKAAWVGPYITDDPGCYAYHGAWFPGRGLLQTAPLNLRVYHGGKGNDWIGIGLSGPYTQDPRDPDEMAQLLHWLIVLRVLFAPDLTGWCRHSDYDPNKKDPGPGITGEFIRLAGLEWRLPPGVST